MAADIITTIEQALVARLKSGLGKLVKSVESYGGEFDEENLAEAIKAFPAAWVTFGGVRKSSAVDMRKTKWKAEGSFVVMVGNISTRSEAATRQGGASTREIGTNLLVSAVRRLLTQQALGLEIERLSPGSVRTLYNTRIQKQAFSVFAVEFHTSWVEYTLDDGTWPQPGAGTDESTDLDNLIATYAGQTATPDADLEGVGLQQYLHPADETGTPDLDTQVTLGGQA